MTKTFLNLPNTNFTPLSYSDTCLIEIKSIKARILEESREAELNKSKKLAKIKKMCYNQL